MCVRPMFVEAIVVSKVRVYEQMNYELRIPCVGFRWLRNRHSENKLVLS